MSTDLILPDEDGWVNARALFEALHPSGTKTKYTDWIKRRLKPNKHVAGLDFVSFRANAKRASGGSVRTEYLVSLYLADHWAMMEDTEASEAIRNLYIQCKRAVMGMATEIAKLRIENAKLKEPKQKRLSDGRVLETITNIVETRDMFGNVTVEKRVTKKYRDEMTETERRLAALQHCARVQEGLAKKIRDEACGDNLIPFKAKA